MFHFTVDFESLLSPAERGDKKDQHELWANSRKFYMLFLTQAIVFSCCIISMTGSATRQSIEKRNDHRLPYGRKRYRAKNLLMKSLSLDIRVSIIEYLQPCDIKKFMKSCKFNLHSCQQFIHRLLSREFHFLLSTSTAINIEHLMQIPLVDTLKINVSRMPIYFGKKNWIFNATSSKYIGIEDSTNNAFISFWLQRIRRNPFSKWKIITIVFGERHLDSISMSDGPFSYFRSVKIGKSEINDTNKCINAIGELLLSGRTEWENESWCFKYEWDSIMNPHSNQAGHLCDACIRVAISISCLICLPIIILVIVYVT